MNSCIKPFPVYNQNVNRKRILIVDDDEELQTLVKEMLERNGFGCIAVSTVGAALEQLKNMNPDLILLDLEFRKIDGTAFLQHAREWMGPGEKVPPIVVLSGHNDRDIVDHVLEAGAVGFVTKPFEAKELLSVIREYIRD
ncbi:MAG: hypothetical protein A3H42_01525 [Deltaproteobacteria bacterium RIFCSPLOWO2_02_FULL_46_8]|nr:MAG: hypothetical protein A3H42_01525 [Deltaproteobacteria bacterium RIFCSPLOWO2_02_FULL_46_8]